jgi:hypothetical protein
MRIGRRTQRVSSGNAYCHDDEDDVGDGAAAAAAAGAGTGARHRAGACGGGGGGGGGWVTTAVVAFHTMEAMPITEGKRKQKYYCVSCTANGGRVVPGGLKPVMQ